MDCGGKGVNFGVAIHSFEQLPGLFGGRKMELRVVGGDNLPFFAGGCGCHFNVFTKVLVFFVALRILSGFV